MQKFFSKLVLLSCLTIVTSITGCSAPRGLEHKASLPTPYQEPAADEQTKQFALSVGEAMTDTQITLPWSPIGENVNIFSGTFYTNGLGERCKKAYYQVNNANIQFAVCQNAETKTWHYVKPLKK